MGRPSSRPIPPWDPKVAWIDNRKLDTGKVTGERGLPVAKNILPPVGDVTARLQAAQPSAFGMSTRWPCATSRATSDSRTP
ncbi:MAG: hypothetical protein U1F10_16465 [Burkholderiales bacterium]